MNMDRIPDAIDFVHALRAGDAFTLRGRTYTFAGHGGGTMGWDARGEYAKFQVFRRSGGGYTLVTVRPTDKVGRA